MTPKEKLKVHAEIERDNARKMKAWERKKAVKESYSKYCRNGEFEVARLLLRFLRNGVVTLGLYDEANTVEQLLDRIGFKPYYGRNYNTAVYHL